MLTRYERKRIRFIAMKENRIRRMLELRYAQAAGFKFQFGMPRRNAIVPGHLPGIVGATQRASPPNL
jgi:hypothetical protein